MAGNHMSTLSPRQRMINMMYLVLTALLALNVSKSVLDAFFRVDKTLTQSVSDKMEDNLVRYEIFEERARNNPEKVGEWNDLAQALKAKTKIVDDLIDSIRYELWKAGGPTLEDEDIPITDRMESEKSFMTATGGQNAGFEILDKANKNIPKNIMLGSDGTDGSATRLRHVLTDYREYLLALDLWPLNDTLSKATVYELLKTEDVPGEVTTKSWEEEEYGEYPLVGVLTFLNQTRLNVRTAEDIMLELIEQKTGKSIVSIDKQIPYAIGNSYVMQGDDVEVDLFLAGIDTKTIPVYALYELGDTLNPMEGPGFGMPLPKGTKIEYTTRENQEGGIDTTGVNFKPNPTYLLQDSLPTNSDGMGSYISEMNIKGTQYIGGFATVKSADGDLTYPWVMKVQVESPMPVVAPTNLNVIYAGIENDFTIAAPGNDPKDLKLVSNVGSKLKITKTNEPGKYKLFMSPENFAKTQQIKLSIKDKEGKNIGKPIAFRVFGLPDAKTSVNGDPDLSEDCLMGVAQLNLARNLLAYKDPSFVYDLTYVVVAYKFRYQDATGGTQTLQFEGSPDLDPQVLNILRNAKSGQTLTFFDIKTARFQNQKRQPGLNDAASINITVK